MSLILYKGKKQKASLSPRGRETDIKGRSRGGLSFTFCAYNSNAACVTLSKLLTLPILAQPR